MKKYMIMHIMLLAYSLTGVLTKLASAAPFLGLRFCLCYGGVLLLMLFYAGIWQQVIKNMPLSTAYATKAVGIIWGLVWGYVIFRECPTLGQIAGAVLVMAGIVLFALSDKEEIHQ